MIDALTFDLAAIGHFLKDIYASEHFNRNLIQGVFISLIIYIIFKYLINPLWKLYFYRKQGFSAEFAPFKNSFKVKTHSALKRYNDALYDFKQLSQQNQKQRAITFNLIATPAVVLLDPSLNQEFASYQNCYDVKDVVGDFARIFTKGLSNAKGNEWKKQRKIISFSFHSEFIKDNLSLMQQCTIESLNKLEQQNLESIPVIKTMENLIGETIGRIFFGENIQEYSIKGQTVTAHLLSTLEKVEKVCKSKPYMLFGSSLIKRRIFKSHKVLLDDLRILENACRRLLVERKNAHGDQKDLAWRLLGSQYNSTDESRLSDETIIANYADLVIAGAGPTAHLIGMALYELSRHPEMMTKLAEEIRGIYNQQTIISIDSLNKMNWLTAILKETQRMYNPKMLGAGFKLALNDHKIGNIKIKKGTLVSACFATSCFDPEYFEDPFDFKPQRWIEKSIKNESFLFTPFGIGQRNCIGQQFAMIIAKIVLSEFVNRFDFKVREGYVPKLGLRKLYGLEDGLPMDLTHRKE